MDAEDLFGRLAGIWDEQAEAMDSAMGAHGPAARRALDVRPGERVVDLGCGPGLSAVALGSQVGRRGWVGAIDIAPDMVRAAARRMAAAGVHGAAVTGDVAGVDVAAVAGEGRPFDAAHSRFGLMFFPEPATAFANIGRALRPGIRIVGAEPALADDAAESRRTGRLAAQRPPVSIADGLRAPLGALTFPLVRDLVDDIVVVDEAAIVDAMRFAFEQAALVIEPSAAVGLAALASGTCGGDASRPTVVVLCGANVDLSRLPWLAAAR